MIRKYLNIKVLLGAVGLALTAFIVLLTLLWLSKPEQTVPVNATAIVMVIPAPSSTPVLSAPTQIATPNTLPDTPPPEEISIGAYVQVTGTGGTGLRLRVSPSLDAEVRLLGSEAEVFEVREGPREAGGYTWWYLVGPYDETRHGWAVKDYLVVIQTP